ncbi:MAG: hypothetical protein ABW186_00965 [Rhodanobacteraceae bacterium]
MLEKYTIAASFVITVRSERAIAAKFPNVTPAKAGVHFGFAAASARQSEMDPGLRRDDD